MIENLFKQHEVPLWGIVSLGEIIEHTDGYSCITFCLPYDSAAVAALPDDDLMNRCKKELSERTRAVYKAIVKECSEYRFVFYDDVDKELKLREKGISQKVLAHLAGLGWIGRSSLLITSKFGPRVRLGTIFTKDDLEFKFTGHLCSGDCGDCMTCAEICPAGAISKNSYDVNKCRQIVTDARGEYRTFCGLCMQVCPQGNAINRGTLTANSPRVLAAGDA